MSDLPSSPLRPRPDPRSLLSAEQVAGVPASTGTLPSDAALQDAVAGNLDSASPTGTMLLARLMASCAGRLKTLPSRPSSSSPA